MSELKPKLQQMLDYLHTFITQNGYAPTIRDLAQGLNISSFTTVKQRLDALAELGFIERTSGNARGIRLMKHGRDTFPEPMQIPLLGQISAGQPILAQEQCEGMISLPPEMVGRGTFFALRIKGDSMVNAGIGDGDVVVVRQQKDAENGAIVAALIGEEATVKRYYRERAHVRLQPENPDYSPIKVIDPMILGKVVTVIRRVTCEP